MFAPELFAGDSILDGPSIFEQQGMIPLEHSSSPEFMRKDSVMSDMLNNNDVPMEDSTPLTEQKKREKTSTKPRDPDKPKDTRHSSKNEGQHTDRRYLCYICHKLFTRRRSVRDHLNKIHGEKTWEPQRSLEVVVEPHSGEPIEPIEEIVARGLPLPPAKSRTLKPPREESSTNEEPASKVLADVPEEEEDTPLILQAQKGIDKAHSALKTVENAPEALPQHDELPFAAQQEEFVPELEPSPQPTLPSKIKKEESQMSEPRPVSVKPSASIPAPIIGKKRPLPMNKKGTAKIKSSTPSSKRLKLSDSDRTPTRSPSVTPAQKVGSKLKNTANVASPSSRASSRQASPTPSASVGTPASSNDDGEVFCICRKGDNHTWMIACDGPCEEWYHGKCIGIRERDGELIDKFFCPMCQEKQGLVTTWKRMCRRLDCRKPARVLDDPPSKYCSVECGRMFFVDLLQRGDQEAQASRDGQFVVEKNREKKLRKKVKKDHRVKRHADLTDTPVHSRPQTPAYSDDEKSEYETDSSADEDDLPNRGGALRAGEVQALVQQCRSIESWRDLGKKPQTPPRELDDNKDDKQLAFDDYQEARMRAIKQELADLDEKLHVLDQREKMLEMVKTRSQSIADDVKKGNPKLKSICGYDPRCAWNDAEFLAWYQAGGREVLESGKIGPPDEDKDVNMVDGVEDSDEDEKATTMKGGVCIRNNCPKHGRTWQKSQLAELRFEQDLLKKKQDHLAVQEHDIRSRAQIRALELQDPA